MNWLRDLEGFQQLYRTVQRGGLPTLAGYLQDSTSDFAISSGQKLLDPTKFPEVARLIRRMHDHNIINCYR